MSTVKYIKRHQTSSFSYEDLKALIVYCAEHEFYKDEDGDIWKNVFSCDKAITPGKIITPEQIISDFLAEKQQEVKK